MNAFAPDVLAGSMESDGGWLSARDARLRVSLTLPFALLTLSLNQLPALMGALALGLVLALGSGLGWGELGRRLLLLEAFMLLLALTLIFSMPGQTAFQLGPLVVSEAGLSRALIIVLKANAVVLALIGLVGNLDPVVLGHALGRLRMPEKLVHLLLQTVRQVQLLHQEYRRLRQAMRARAFVPRSDRHTWSSLGWLIGMLLVRAMGRSRRVLAAMRCRGFRGRLYLLDMPLWTPGDTVFAVAFGGALVGLLILDRFQ